MKLRFVLLLSVFLLLVFAGCSQNNNVESSSESGDNFPDKTIEIVVPYAPGGGTDLIARTLAKHIPKHLPNEQSISIINKDGGGGVVGTTEFLKAQPDGYEILLGPTELFTNQPHFNELTFDKDSFEPLVKIATARQVLLVQEDAPWDNYEEWYSDVQDNPGEYSYGITAIGTTPHVAMEMLNSAVEIDTKAVPFGGVGPAKTDLQGGHVEGVVGPIVGNDKGVLRALFSFSGERGDNTPDVPTLKEEGIDIGLDVIQCAFVPKDTPKEIQNILHDAIKQTMEDPEFIEDFKSTELDLTYASGEDLKNEMNSEYSKYGEVWEDLDVSE